MKGICDHLNSREIGVGSQRAVLVQRNALEAVIFNIHLNKAAIAAKAMIIHFSLIVKTENASLAGASDFDSDTG